MPLNKRNSRTFHRTLYAGQLQSVRLLKRDDDQGQGTVTAYVLYQCRRSMVLKTGETIAGDESSSHHTMWHIPRTELDRVGVNYISAADRIVDEQNRYWQPESASLIQIKVFENFLTLDCLRVK